MDSTKKFCNLVSHGINIDVVWRNLNQLSKQTITGSSPHATMIDVANLTQF